MMSKCKILGNISPPRSKPFTFTLGISDKTYYGWRKRYGGMGRAKLTEFKALEKENQRLKKILAELELDKLILKESLDYLKPRA